MQVYHISSDSYEMQNQHYGRSLTKETVKDGKEFVCHRSVLWDIIYLYNCMKKQSVCSHFNRPFLSACQVAL